jgi:uncharacterized repeat protein (TIGR01451 family)
VIVWRVRINNALAGSFAENLVITDILPPNMNQIAPTLPPAGQVFGTVTTTVIGGLNYVIWNLGDLPADGVPRDLLITGTINPTDTSTCDVDTFNQALALYGCDDGCRAEALTATARLRTRPELALSYNDLSNFNVCGDPMQIRVSVTGLPAYNVLLSHTIPSGYQFGGLISSTTIPSSTEYSNLSQTVVMTWAVLQPGNYDLFFTVTHAGGITAENVCVLPATTPNQSYLAFDDNSICLGTPPFSVTANPQLTIVQPALVVTKTPVLTTANDGQVITWLVEVANTSLAEARNVVVTDTVGPAFMTSTIDAGPGSDGAVPVISGTSIVWNLNAPLAVTVIPTVTRVISRYNEVNYAVSQTSTTQLVTTTVQTRTISSDTLYPVGETISGPVVITDQKLLYNQTTLREFLVDPPAEYSFTIPSPNFSIISQTVTESNGVITVTTIQTDTRQLVTTTVYYLYNFVSTRQQVLTPQLIIPAVWSATVTATVTDEGQLLQNRLAAQSGCDSGCASAVASTTAYVSLLSRFDKGPDEQRGTIGDRAVFSFTSSLGGNDFLYQNVVFTDALPAGLDYLDSVFTYTVDGDGSDGGPITSTAAPPQIITPGNNTDPSYLVWSLPALSGTVSFGAVITTVIRNIPTNTHGSVQTNTLYFAYNQPGTDYASSSAIPPGLRLWNQFLHVGKSYVTADSCQATLLADNFNSGTAAGWTATPSFTQSILLPPA